MGIRFRLASFALAALLAAPASAGVLTSATFGFEIASVPPALFTASGLVGAGAAAGTASTAAWSVAAGAVPTGTTTVPDPYGVPITEWEFRAQGNPATGVFAAGAPAPMPVLFRALPKFGGGFALLDVPVTLGVPGTQTFLSAGVTVSLFPGSWTSGTVTVTWVTTPSPTNVPSTHVSTRMGSNGLVNGAGVVVLVSPLLVDTGAIAGQGPAFATLTLVYAPEPRGLGLLGAGFAALLLLGARRR